MLISKIDSSNEIYLAENGKEALKLCDENNFDLIFTDIKMPEMDGLEFISQIYKKVKEIVIISGYPDFSYAQKAIEYGVSNYLLKPVNPSKLKQVIQSTKMKVKALKSACLKSYLLNYQTINDRQKQIYINKLNLQKYYAFFNLTIEYYDENLKDEILDYTKKLVNNLEVKENMDIVCISIKDKIVGLVTSNQREILVDIKPYMEKISNDNTCISSDIYTDKENVYDIYKEFEENVDRENADGSKLINTIKDYIHKNYSKTINLSDIAEIAYVHPTYISKVFKKETGQNLTDYILEYRINKAKQLLENSKYKIYEVAQNTGFNDSKYFGNVFKSIVGKTPSEYRNSL